MSIVLSCAGRAAAQTEPSIAARTWAPSIDPSAGLVLEPIQSPGPWQWSFSSWLSYAQSPVVLRDANNNVVSRPLDHALGLDLVAGLGLGDRAGVGVDVPVLVYQNGTTGLPATVVSGGRETTLLFASRKTTGDCAYDSQLLKLHCHGPGD